MALTESTMMPLGTPAPDFTLPEPREAGHPCGLVQVRGEHATLVCFICNHCPFVQHIEAALIQLGMDYLPRGVGMVAISANDARAFPEDGPAQMAAKVYPFPYLYDETQQVARAYGAACTPDLFLFDEQLRCVYRGQFDASRPGNNEPVTGAALRSALEALLAGQLPSVDQRPSIGCSIKWK